jgi:hypothetical protein
MRKRPFHSKCPCCGEKLIVDPELRRLDPVDKSKRQDDKRIDEATRVLEEDEKRRQDSFDAALEDEKKDKPSLDDLL